MPNTQNTREPIRILGLMTGSSADGLDICLVEFTGLDTKPEFRILHSTEIPYPDHFRSAFINPLELSKEQINTLDQELGQWFATEVSKLNLNFDVIASHGQTISHNPPISTLQIGNPKFMSDQFNVPVIYDFRTADIKQGGQGAPLIPIVDRLLFQRNDTDILALNIGGISNLTIVPGKHNPAPLLAWDTGPGNTLIDKAVRVFSRGKLNYDPEGSIAAQGFAYPKLLEHLLNHKFYDITPPRSAGQEQFGKLYFENMLKLFLHSTDQQFKDIIYTLTVLTARTIADACLDISNNYTPNTMFVAGGGVYNHTLLKLIKTYLPEIIVKRVDHLGVTESNKEAFGFAYLGYLHLLNLPGNIPSVTGAKQEVVLGKLFPPT